MHHGFNFCCLAFKPSEIMVSLIETWLPNKAFGVKKLNYKLVPPNLKFAFALQEEENY